MQDNRRIKIYNTKCLKFSLCNIICCPHQQFDKHVFISTAPQFFFIRSSRSVNSSKGIGYSPKQFNAVPEKLNIKMFRFEFEEILDAPHLKTVS